jgi:hypothetical protein
VGRSDSDFHSRVEAADREAVRGEDGSGVALFAGAGARRRSRAKQRAACPAAHVLLLG